MTWYRVSHIYTDYHYLIIAWCAMKVAHLIKEENCGIIISQKLYLFFKSNQTMEQVNSDSYYFFQDNIGTIQNLW